MANELEFQGGLPVTLPYGKANVEPNTNTLLTLGQGRGGFVVPTRYKFHAMCLVVTCNGTIAAGSLVAKVTADNTALANGPSVTLDANTGSAVAVARVGMEPIAAGKVVKVNIASASNYSPNTGDIDALVIGRLLPA